MIKAHEIQGVLALNHSFNRVGLDHVLLVRIASTAVATQLLGGTREQIVDGVANAWIDGGALRTYRHAPNTGSRKSWAAGDATSRAVRLALIALTGEMGYPSALTAKSWGFQDVLFKGQPIALERPLGSYVMENVLFKISFPAEFHAQTAVEAAMTFHRRWRPAAGDSQDRDRDAGGRCADHRQDRASCEPGRSRSLSAVHGGCAADLWAVDGRRLRGRCCAGSAYRSAACDYGRDGKRRVQSRLPRSRQARHRQRRDGSLRGRHEHGARRDRLSGRASSPPRRRHTAAAREVPAESRDAARKRAGSADRAGVRGSSALGVAAGARFHVSMGSGYAV